MDVRQWRIMNPDRRETNEVGPTHTLLNAYWDAVLLHRVKDTPKLPKRKAQINSRKGKGAAAWKAEQRWGESCWKVHHKSAQASALHMPTHVWQEIEKPEKLLKEWTETIPTVHTGPLIIPTPTRQSWKFHRASKFMENSECFISVAEKTNPRC